MDKIALIFWLDDDDDNDDVVDVDDVGGSRCVVYSYFGLVLETGQWL